MSSLREIKDRIGSVRSTLKITSAMKLVASSKLRKAQRAVETLRPYEETLSDILSSVSSVSVDPSHSCGHGRPHSLEESRPRTVIVAVASNSSLCGGFNVNAVKKMQEVAAESDVVKIIPIGRRMVEAAKKNGCVPEKDLNELVAHPSYDMAASLASELVRGYEAGEYDRVVLVYNHFVSTARQQSVAETYLPFSMEPAEPVSGLPEDMILEPSADEILAELLPKVMSLKIYAMVLDSVASEHAARMVAMQAATDNAEELLASLSLEYNKGRQQKITSEILDLVGGSQQ